MLRITMSDLSEESLKLENVNKQIIKNLCESLEEFIPKGGKLDPYMVTNREVYLDVIYKNITFMSLKGSVPYIFSCIEDIKEFFRTAKKRYRSITEYFKNLPLEDTVDLGLPSGTLWATHNVGAHNETVTLQASWLVMTM